MKYEFFELVNPSKVVAELNRYGQYGWHLVPGTWHRLPSGYTSWLMEKPLGGHLEEN